MVAPSQNPLRDLIGKWAWGLSYDYKSGRLRAWTRELIDLRFVHYRGNVLPMIIAKSRLTAQGQISVPAEVRQRLGVGPGSVLEWDEQDDQVVVRRAGRYTSEEVHRALFPDGAPAGSAPDVKEAIRKYVRKKHAGR